MGQKIQQNAHRSMLPRAVSPDRGRASSPRASGDQGMDPTPKYLLKASGRAEIIKIQVNLEGRKHLPFLLAVEKVVVVLHRDETRELVIYGVVCRREAHLKMRFSN
jgi:hypothetical protein